MNYFKKKNKYAIKVRTPKLKTTHSYQPQFLKDPRKNKRDKSNEQLQLATNSLDAYFDVNNIIR